MDVLKKLTGSGMFPSSLWIRTIDVVPDAVIWMVNWLHYLNYEAVSSGSSTHHYLVQGMS